MSMEIHRMGGGADLKNIPSEINHHRPKVKKKEKSGWQTTSRNNIHVFSRIPKRICVITQAHGLHLREN